MNAHIHSLSFNCCCRRLERWRKTLTTMSCARKICRLKACVKKLPTADSRAVIGLKVKIVHLMRHFVTSSRQCTTHYHTPHPPTHIYLHTSAACIVTFTPLTLLYRYLQSSHVQRCFDSLFSVRSCSWFKHRAPPGVRNFPTIFG